MHSVIFAITADKIKGALKQHRKKSKDYPSYKWDSFADSIGDGIHFNQEARNLTGLLAQYDPSVRIRFDHGGSRNPDFGHAPCLTITQKALEGYLAERFASYNAHKDMTFDQFTELDIKSDNMFEAQRAFDDNFSYHMDEPKFTGLVSLDKWVRYRYREMVREHTNKITVRLIGVVDYHC